ncbi:MAG TPA: NADH-quinone oxidoreductase subunit B [Mycobacteriales bacterium]|nr:NADH-quinone oxidoreductase subunit B [Mycobacteriales bacterium]
MSSTTVEWGHTYRLHVLDVGLACCAVEFVAAAARREELDALSARPFTPEPREADVMVVSGTVTDKLAPAVKGLYDEMPEGAFVISFGSCANCGGPYWDSYSVTKGVDQLIPVDVYVPGCPPRPEALLGGLAALHERVGAAG